MLEAAVPFTNSAVAGPSVIELRPHYMLAIDLVQPLTMILGEGAATAVEKENLVVVMGDKSTLEKAKLLLHQLDRPRRQVRITGYIYDVDLSELERLGVDWNQQFMTQAVDANGLPRNVAAVQGGLLTPIPTAAESAGAAAATTAATDPTGSQFAFRTLNRNFELRSFVQALDQTRGSRLLADPHVTVVDRYTASLGIVTKIPIQQLTQTQQGGSIGTTTFAEAGIKLDVTPHIADDGTIEMEVPPSLACSTVTKTVIRSSIHDRRPPWFESRMARRSLSADSGEKQK